MESLAGERELRRPSSDPIRASSQVEGALARMGVPGVAANLRIRRDWRKLVSGPWRERARPLVLEEGCLVVEVASPMDATLRRYGGAGLINQLNEALGSQMILRVRAQVSGAWHKQ